MLIVGTGAVATLLAQNLALYGQRFQLFGPPSRRVQALSERFGRAVITEPEKVCPDQAWLVAVKSWQNEEKIRVLREAPPAVRILVVQNGLEPELPWAELSQTSVERALCSYGVKTEVPGVVEGGNEGELVLKEGSLFSALLTSTGLCCREVADMRAACWHKLAVNASLNVVASIYGLTNGEVLRHPRASSLARAASEEVRTVAVAAGVAWGDIDPWTLTSSIAAQTSTNVCSTLADLRGGRPTEYDSINGEVLRRARAAGLAVPALSELDRRFGSLLEAKVRAEAC